LIEIRLINFYLGVFTDVEDVFRGRRSTSGGPPEIGGRRRARSVGGWVFVDPSMSECVFD